MADFPVKSRQQWIDELDAGFCFFVEMFSILLFRYHRMGLLHDQDALVCVTRVQAAREKIVFRANRSVAATLDSVYFEGPRQK